MKSLKQISLALILMVCGIAVQAQQTPAKVFSGSDLVWYGLDFTEARFIGKFEQGFDENRVSGSDLINKYIPSWNKLVLEEPQNFDLKNSFRKTNIYYDIKPVESLNAKINSEGILTYNSYMLMKDKLPGMVKAYPEGEKKEGLGLVFIVESFDKSYRKGNFWIVFFDIQSRKILFSDYCSGTPAGFGLRNYWAGSVKRVLWEIQTLRYNIWKKAAIRDNQQVVTN